MKLVFLALTPYLMMVSGQGPGSNATSIGNIGANNFSVPVFSPSQSTTVTLSPQNDDLGWYLLGKQESALAACDEKLAECLADLVVDRNQTNVPGDGPEGDSGDGSKDFTQSRSWALIGGGTVVATAIFGTLVCCCRSAGSYANTKAGGNVGYYKNNGEPAEARIETMYADLIGQWVRLLPWNTNARRAVFFHKLIEKVEDRLSYESAKIEKLEAKARSFPGAGVELSNADAAVKEALIKDLQNMKKRHEILMDILQPEFAQADATKDLSSTEEELKTAKNSKPKKQPAEHEAVNTQASSSTVVQATFTTPESGKPLPSLVKMSDDVEKIKLLHGQLTSLKNDLETRGFLLTKLIEALRGSDS